MSRNFRGEKLCRVYLIECFTEAYQGIKTEFSEAQQELFDNNIMEFWKHCFNEEHNSEFDKYEHPNLQDRIEDYYKQGPSLYLPVYWHEVDKLRDEWGYTTEIGKWEEGFYRTLAFRTLQLCDKYKVDITDLY